MTSSLTLYGKDRRKTPVLESCSRILYSTPADLSASSSHSRRSGQSSHHGFIGRTTPRPGLSAGGAAEAAQESSVVQEDGGRGRVHGACTPPPGILGGSGGCPSWCCPASS